ncbi:PEP-CTERM sorting domain-containing protein [Paucibacter sp. PLA-PC-4]|uniref:PEP-CTERM sorting domain-containing protein n=1 Tax=Paucibacter sp. PLA-PC-4 TaxID=2993655 RepID=UPI00224B52B3|nr:PEP-CTERM sorting domain-containing protein [Paucibacter sp. PLA-PC-4]MCX2864676.1 PEP-CTERM sorting domain-containing protein [Paucibacter sp. PLA-PC-4]
MNKTLLKALPALLLGLASLAAQAELLDIRMNGQLGAHSQGAAQAAPGSFAGAVAPGAEFSLQLRIDSAALGENLEWEDHVQLYEGGFVQAATLTVGGVSHHFDLSSGFASLKLDRKAYYPGELGGRGQPASSEQDGLMLGWRDGAGEDRVSLSFVLPDLFQNLPFDIATWQGSYSATAMLPPNAQGNWDYGSFQLGAGLQQSAGYFRAEGLTVSVVPEPASYALLLGGVALLGGLARRRGHSGL